MLSQEYKMCLYESKKGSLPLFTPHRILYFQRASLVAQMVENLPEEQKMWVGSLGQEDPLEEGMATCSSILSGKSHGQRSLVGYSPWGSQRIRHY